MIAKKSDISLENIITIVFIFSIFCFGAFYEWTGSLLSVIFSAILLIYKSKNGMHVYKSIPFYCIGIITVFYGVACIYALDSAMAFTGFAKKASIFLFLLLCMQIEDSIRKKLLSYLPALGCIMVLAGTVAWFIPPIKSVFFINGRLSGFFQYANTFALFLICGILILGFVEKVTAKIIAEFIILLFGVLFTGSRMGFIFLIFAVAVIVVKGNGVNSYIGTRKKLFFIISAVVLLFLCAISFFAFRTGNFNGVTRFLSIRFSASTLQGRFLYMYDGLRILFKHPFGLGYMGFYYIQSSIQSGVYDVRYVHNDLLQIMLDAGMIAGAAAFILILSQLFSKKLEFKNKVLILFICLYSLFDFHMEYLSIAFILILIMDIKGDERNIKIKKSFSVITGLLVLCIGVEVYMTVPLAAYQTGNYKMAYKTYHNYTDAKLHLLSNTESVKDAKNLSIDILKNNSYCTLAYDALAQSELLEKHYKKAILYKKKAVLSDKYSNQEYNDFAVYLIQGILYYKENKDEKSALKCLDEIHKLQKHMESVKSTVSVFGKSISDKVFLEFDKSIKDDIKNCEEILHYSK